MTSDTAKPRAVVSAGRIYCDLVFTGAGGMPVPGRELFAEDLTIAAGGGAFISAAHLALRGRKTALAARLGIDPLSLSLEGQLADSGVDLRFVERAEDAGPQVTVVMVDGGERAFLSRRIGPARARSLNAALRWEEACHLHIAEYATLDEMPGLVREARAQGLTVSLDPSWDARLIGRPDFLESCAGVDVFLPNVDEARIITGAAGPEQALAVLAESFPVVALKAGGRGAFAAASGRTAYRAADKVPVVDTTGAGDAFNAGFIDAWLDSAPVDDCLKAGVDAGGLAVQAPGGAGSLGRPLDRSLRQGGAPAS